MNLLIVKTSSLGDIIQTLPVLEFLHAKLPGVKVDWLVAEELAPIVASHPLIHRVLPIVKSHFYLSLRQNMKTIRHTRYTYVFDLQGNCKSGLWTLLTRAEQKIGLSFTSVREWPNILATSVRFTVPREQNVRLQYLSLFEQFFKFTRAYPKKSISFSLSEREKEFVQELLKRSELQGSCRIMVCPGAKWKNKRLAPETLLALLQKIHEVYDAKFLFVWGTEAERQECAAMQSVFSQNSSLMDKLPLPTWQYLMSQIDLVLAVDSSALHLCGTTDTPSFSIFGPTDSSVFQPIGPQHASYQGSCPYGRVFHRTCPVLRSCQSGACMKALDAEDLFQKFQAHYQRL